MEKTMDWEQNTLLNELTQGRELTNMLRKHLHPSSSPETCRVLLEKILCSYEKALSMLNWSGSTVETKPSPASSDAFDKKDMFKKRKTSSGGIQQIRVCPGTLLEGPLDDGYCWRKYGQKDILGSNFPRGYYRCTHRYSQGCLAAKQVQRSDQDPTVFEVKYRGRHTCNQVSYLPRTIMSMETQKRSKEMFLSFETGLKVKTEELDSGREDVFPSFSLPIEADELDSREDVFPSFSLPIEADEVENQNGLFVKPCMENEIMVPSFVSPATSDSNYFSLSTFDIGSFGLGQNVQASESDLTEIISALTSRTDSPSVDLDISSLEKLEFDPSFPFDNPDFFY